MWYKILYTCLHVISGDFFQRADKMKIDDYVKGLIRFFLKKKKTNKTYEILRFYECTPIPLKSSGW